jgi:pimeloyl-ACP methyl ester carboxylesterase
VAGSTESNPDVLSGAPSPLVGYYGIAGTCLYAEIRGSGPPLLVIGAADEDAEFYRGIAERLADELTVVTYDRRGTRRSGREDWPGGGSVQHADDAAALLAELGLQDVTVLGSSAGAIVALRLALRHAEVVKTALCFEPGLFRLARGGDELRHRGQAAVQEHLASHPDDWAGASAALGRAAVDAIEVDSRGLFTPPEGREWFAKRADSNAESLLRGDLPLTGEIVEIDAVASCPAGVRFAYGTASLPVFREITTRLAAARGTTPDALEGMGHSLFYDPDTAATYIRRFAD